MSLLGRAHLAFVHSGRVRVLAAALAPLIPESARVLDVGCGDGRLACEIARLRPDLRLEGVDVLARSDARIPVRLYDGATLPIPDDAFDAILMVDVVHHARDPLRLLAECARVARRAIIIKDHTCDRMGAVPLLRFMDWFGNARHGVSLPYSYWTRAEWETRLPLTGLAVEEWTGRLRLYPRPADWVFGGSLHFVARLTPARNSGAREVRGPS